MPRKVLKRMLKIYPITTIEYLEKNDIEEKLEKNWGQKKSGLNSIKLIKKPTHSEDLAEFIGILIGDGHMWKNGVRITGNALEINHHKYIQTLVTSLFGLDAYVRVYTKTNKDQVSLTDIYSRNLVYFLENMNLKIGNKIKNKIRIPNWIFKDKNFTYGTLRGLFDTDGGVYQKQKGYNRIFIEFQNHCQETLKDIKKLIETAGFTPSKSSINLRIQNQNEIKKFFEIVGSSNPKNIIRFNEYLKNEFIPLKDELSKKILNSSYNQQFKLRS